MPHLKKPDTVADRERMRVGGEIGRLARELRPNGILAWRPGITNEAAAQRTQRLISGGAPCVLEATFIADGCVARVDAISGVVGGDWLIEETKSSTVKEPKRLLQDGKVHDVAFQAQVASNAGLHVGGTSLILINNQYRWEGGPYDPSQLFGSVDVTEECREVSVNVAKTIEELKPVLSATAQPEVETNTHCTGCGFYDHCHREQPVHDVVFLPLIRRDRVRELRAYGFPTIDLIPEDDALPEKMKALSAGMKRARDVVVTGKPFVSEGLRTDLEAIRLRAAFIDFESCTEALPRFASVRPYVQVCFQWSAHVVETFDAPPQHSEFLQEEDSDPRPEFCRTLWTAIKDCSSVVHYSAFEKTQLKAMADEEILYARELADLLDERGTDLEKVVKDNVYYAEFKGKTSIKNVLPVLAPSMSYDGLAIDNGDAASVAFLELVSEETPGERRAEISQALSEYCERDTLAMVEVFNALRALASTA